MTKRWAIKRMYKSKPLLCTTYGNLLGMAGGDLIDIWKNSQKSPSLSKKLQNISSVELLLGKKTGMNKLKETTTIKYLCLLSRFEWRSGVRFMFLCTYLFLLEGLHQLGHLAEGNGEGRTGAAVAVGHLNTLVAKIALPVCVATYFILTKDVGYEVSYVKSKREREREWSGRRSRLRAQTQVSSASVAQWSQPSYFHCWLGWSGSSRNRRNCRAAGGKKRIWIN